MAIMQTCCCWRNVRRGSFACAVYSIVYSLCVIFIMVSSLVDESQYLSGNISVPQSKTNLELNNISPVTVRFHIALLIVSVFGFISGLILLYGLIKDRRMFLIPWICQMITLILLDLAYYMYLCISSTSKFKPYTALLCTLGFFHSCLNIYSLLCVISQFQEYTAGRGTAACDNENRGPIARYTAAQQATTVTSIISSRKTTNNDTKTTGSTTPKQSPTAIIPSITFEKTLTVRFPRKHVQFDAGNQVGQTDHANSSLEIDSLDTSSLNSKK